MRRASVVAGSVFSYFVRVQNNGPSTARTVVVEDALPAGIIVQSIQGVCAGGFPCTIPELPPGFGETTRVDAFVPIDYAGPPLLNTATVKSETADPDLSNNTDTVSTLVVPDQADLKVEKIQPSVVAPGGTILYTARVTNLGPGPAIDVTSADVIPGGTVLVGGTPPPAPTTCTTPTPGAGNLASCLTPLLPVGGFLDFVFSVQTSPDVAVGSLITNVATVSSPTPDYNQTNDRVEVSTLVVGLTDADVLVEKIDVVDPVVALSEVTYTITVRNAGPATATGVTLTDALPAGFAIGSAVPSQGSCAAATCVLGTLAPGTFATITLVATTTEPGVFTNVATVSAIEPDPLPANNIANQDTTTVALETEADLVLEKTAPGALRPGDASLYTIRVTNRGPAVALNLLVEDILPPQMTFVGNSGSCVTAFPCSLERLLPGESVTIQTTFIVQAGAATPDLATNTATVSSITADPNLANNTSTAATIIDADGTADIEVLKKDSPDAVIAGTQLSYALTVANRGPSAAPDVVLTDVLPPGVTLIAATPTFGTCSGTTTITCEFGTMPVGSIVTVAVLTTAPPEIPAPNPMINQASATTSALDPVPANNSFSEPTTVIAYADVAIVKTGPAAVQPGQSFSYTLSVTNLGPSSASQVTILDPLPAGLTFAGATGPCAGGFPCVIGTVARGAVVDIVVSVTLDPGAIAPGTLVNTATVTTTSIDQVQTNNVSTLTTLISLLTADVTVVKTGPPSTMSGQPITYTFTVVNNGPAPADNVVLTDPTPAGLTFVSATGACAAFPCALGVLAAGETRTITATYDIAADAAAGSTIVNTATVTSTTADPGPGNNTSTATTLVAPHTYYFAEGASGQGFFETRYDLFNPSATQIANVTLRYDLQNGEPCPAASCDVTWAIPPLGHRSTLASDTIGPQPFSFSAVVFSDVAVATERTMTWDDTGRYGSHMESGIPGAATTWYVAEGATHSDFDLWYLVQNPTDTATTVDVRLLRPAPAPAVV